MSKTNYPRKSVIERTIAAARAAGIDVCGIEVGPDGVIRTIVRGIDEPASAQTDYDHWRRAHPRQKGIRP